MRAIVLAGGYAKRLWPLTQDRPKPLLPIGDGFIIDFIIAKMAPLHLDKILISTNKRFESAFTEWIDLRQHKNIEVVSEPSLKEEEKLGPIRALDLILNDSRPDDYLIAAGDNIFSLSLADMLAFYRQVNTPVIALCEIRNKNLAKKYACVEVDGKCHITSFAEKPEEPKSLLVSTGIYMLPWNSFLRIKEYLAKGNPPDPIGRFICWLSETEEAYGLKFIGYWYDIGSLDQYREAQADFLYKSYKSFS